MVNFFLNVLEKLCFWRKLIMGWTQKPLKMKWAKTYTHICAETTEQWDHHLVSKFFEVSRGSMSRSKLLSDLSEMDNFSETLKKVDKNRLIISTSNEFAKKKKPVFCSCDGGCGVANLPKISKLPKITHKKENCISASSHRFLMIFFHFG